MQIYLNRLKEIRTMKNETRKQQILLVDGNELYLSQAENMLKDSYEIITAKSGKEALQYFYKGLFPDMVLIDIFTPYMDGWEAFRRLKAMSFLQDIPIVIVSELRAAATTAHAREIGAEDFIAKPLERDEVLKRIKAVFVANNDIARFPVYEARPAVEIAV
jgi:CheY-like chemotaxis protein